MCEFSFYYLDKVVVYLNKLMNYFKYLFRIEFLLIFEGLRFFETTTFENKFSLLYKSAVTYVNDTNYSGLYFSRGKYWFFCLYLTCVDTADFCWFQVLLGAQLFFETAILFVTLTLSWEEHYLLLWKFC